MTQRACAASSDDRFTLSAHGRFQHELHNLNRASLRVLYVSELRDDLGVLARLVDAPPPTRVAAPAD